MGIRLNISGKKAAIDGTDQAFSSLISGVQGKIILRTPFGKREVKLVDEIKPQPKPKSKTPKKQTKK